MSDSYLIVSENGLVLSYNKSFHEYFGRPFGIRENRLLKDSATAEAENKPCLRHAFGHRALPTRSHAFRMSSL